MLRAMMIKSARTAMVCRPARALFAAAVARGPAAPPPSVTESFLNPSSLPYVEKQLHAWRADPTSVHKVRCSQCQSTRAASLTSLAVVGRLL
jgi:hypothetical protein